MKLSGIAFDDQAVAHQEVNIANARHCELRDDTYATVLQPEPDNALGARLTPSIHESQFLARTRNERGGERSERAPCNEAELERGVGYDNEVAFGEAQQCTFEGKLDVINRVLLEWAGL